MPRILHILLLLALLALPAAAQRPKRGFNRDVAVSNYFYRFNAPLVGTPAPDQPPTPRAVTWVQRVTLFERDGWACILCGSTNHLELDHAVALMNGGPNDAANLHTLCNDCHTAKTAYDFRLRKERRELARKLADPAYRPPLNADSEPAPPAQTDIDGDPFLSAFYSDPGAPDSPSPPPPPPPPSDPDPFVDAALSDPPLPLPAPLE